MGRHRTPDKIHKLNGNPAKKKLNDEELELETSIPDCPDWLDDTAKEEFNRIVTSLEKLGIIQDIDLAPLVAYANAWSRFKEATEQIKTHGTITTTPNGHQQPSPYVTIQRQQAELMMRIAGEFGMTASARSKVLAEKKATKSKLQNILNKNK